MATLLSCLVVMGGWCVLGLALLGTGRTVRWLVTRGPMDWRLGDVWTGLAVAVALVFGAHLVVPVGPVVWLVLAPAGVVGLVLGRRPHLTVSARTAAILAVVVLSALYVADRALQPASGYDSGLYHFPALEWMHDYRAVPGLANFYGRLGYNSGSSAYSALVGSTVSPGVAHHFANSLLFILLVLEILRAVLVILRPGLSAARYVGPVLLLLCTPALLYPLHRSLDISSPSPDLPALVVSLAAAVYLVRALGDDARDADWVPAVSLLALLPVMRVQLVVFSMVGLLFLAWRLARSATPARSRRGVLGLGVLVAWVWGLWVAHGYVLSGYPAYPAAVLGLPVSWRTAPGHAAWDERWIRAWARDPGHRPRRVLADWDWLGGWAGRMVDNTEVLGMMLLVGAGAVLLLGLLIGAGTGRGSRTRRVTALAASAPILVALVAAVVAADGRPGATLLAFAVILVVAIVCVGTTVSTRQHGDTSWRRPAVAVGTAGLAMAAAWFLVAPDPRFATGALWLTAAVPAAVGVSVLASRRRGLALVVGGLVLALAAAYPARGLQKEQDFSLALADPRFPLGLSEPPTTRTVTFTRDGVTFQRPKSGDQCWDDSLPCTPFLEGWRLRDPGHLGAGFVDVSTTRP